MALASAMAIVSGLVCVAAGLARLGFITELLSKPIRYGYMNGIALTVHPQSDSEAPRLFRQRRRTLRQISGIVEGVIGGRTNVAAFAIGGGTLAVILLLKRWPRVPGLLIAVVAAMLVVAMWDLDTSARVVVLGPLPPGLPTLRMPVVHAVIS